MEDQGVDVNKANLNCSPPLHVAVQRDRIDIAIWLMERGMADLNKRNNDGKRPMDLVRSKEMRQVIVNEEKRRRDRNS